MTSQEVLACSTCGETEGTERYTVGTGLPTERQVPWCPRHKPGLDAFLMQNYMFLRNAPDLQRDFARRYMYGSKPYEPADGSPPSYFGYEPEALPSFDEAMARASASSYGSVNVEDYLRIVQGRS